MTTFTSIPHQVEQGLETWNVTPSRRNFLKSAGMLVVSFSAAGAGPLIPGASAQTVAAGAGPYPDPDFRQLDSWIVIHAGQHRDLLRRKDGLRPRYRDSLPPDDV